MATRFVSVPRESIVEALTKAGFTPGVQGSEVVFSRVHHRCKHTVVKVFTSLSARETEAVRGCGEDAIRVVAAYEKKDGNRPVSFGLYKAKRVYRTGSVEAVLARIVERAREAYKACNERCKGEKRCWECCGRPS